MSTTNGSSKTIPSINPSYYQNLFLFVNDLLAYHIPRERYFPLGQFHKEICGHLLSYRYALSIVPRGHLKTSLLNAYACWRLFRESNYELVLVSSTLDQSMKNLSEIQYYLETTPWLQHLLPDDRSTAWNKSTLVTKNRSLIQVKPFSPSARGMHPSEILYDDVLREADVTMDDIKDTFWSIFYPMGQTKHCKHIIVGTPLSQEDLFAEIEQKATEEKIWHVYKKAAIIDYEIGEGKPLWPERFTMAELDRIKKDMGAYRFTREYLCSPVGEGSGFYPIEFILNTLDDDRAFSYTTEGQVYIGCDFAMSESATADYNVFTVVDCLTGPYKRKMKFDRKEVELEVQNPVIVKRIERFKGGTGQVRRIKELWDRYHPIKVIVDNSSFGAKFAQEIRDLGITVEAQDFQPTKRAMLLTNLRKVFETDNPKVIPPRLIIPYSQADETQSIVKHLVRELSGFRETKTKGGYQTIASK